MQKLNWKTTQVKPNEVIFFEHNPRLVKDKGYKDLKQSIEEFDIVEIPTLDFDKTCIAGHQRIRVLIEKGRGNEAIDMRMPNRKLTEKEFKKLNLILNRHAGVFDADILANVFEFDELEFAGFSEEELGLIFVDTFAKTEDPSQRLDKKKEVECPYCHETFEA